MVLVEPALWTRTPTARSPSRPAEKRFSETEPTVERTEAQPAHPTAEPDRGRSRATGSQRRGLDASRGGRGRTVRASMAASVDTAVGSAAHAALFAFGRPAQGPSVCANHGHTHIITLERK